MLIDLIQALRTPYRQGAAFVMNSATLARIRKFKTADGAFLWQPAMASGQPDTLLGYDPPLSAAGTDVQILASGIGDPAPVLASAARIGEALRPPPPIHVSAERRNDGGFALHWIRESRVGWSWLDASDAPLGEDSERYRLTIMRADGVERSYELGTASFDYVAADAAADASTGPMVTVSVVQIGTSAASRPAAITLTL